MHVACVRVACLSVVRLNRRIASCTCCLHEPLFSSNPAGCHVSAVLVTFHRRFFTLLNPFLSLLLPDWLPPAYRPLFHKPHLLVAQTRSHARVVQQARHRVVEVHACDLLLTHPLPSGRWGENLRGLNAMMAWQVGERGQWVLWPLQTRPRTTKRIIKHAIERISSPSRRD